MRPPAKRLAGETWLQGSNPCSSAAHKDPLQTLLERVLLIPYAASLLLTWTAPS